MRSYYNGNAQEVTAMIYTLKHFDTPLLTFSATEDSSFPEIEIKWVNDAHANLLPLDLEPEPESLNRWLRHRTIPKNRAYVHSFLAKCGLNLNRPMSIISVSMGLSLNDCYWVVPEDFDGSFSDYNLYDNRFSRTLALIAFTGYGSSMRSSLASSPEFTTNGMLPKCWRRIDGKVLLYKGGTSGASNTGFEPYSEFYAAQVAEAMGIHAVRYGLSKWKNILCSTCELFTSKRYSFLPVGRLITSGGFQAVTDYYAKPGDSFKIALRDMVVLDAVICNTDRHFGNFGFLIDNQTNEIAAPAPLFDHGNSLFNMAGLDAWESADSLQEYVDTLVPCVYDDFLDTARSMMAEENRERLRRLLTFRFKRNPRYNLPPKRLEMIEEQVRKRARVLLS